MARTARNNWPYPNNDQANYFTAFKNFVNAVDAAFFTTREDKNFVLFGGGVVSFNATSGELTWSSALQGVSATSGFHWYIPEVAAGGTATLQDGEFLFVELTRNPQLAVEVPVSVGSQIDPNDDCLVLAQRLGSAVIWRNGAIIGNGQSIVLFGPRTFTQVVEIPGIVGFASTDSVTFVGLGALKFDPSLYFPGGAGVTLTIKFEAFLSTTDAGTPLPAELRLYDLTNGAPIANSVISSSSLTTQHVESPALEVGVDLPDAATVYEVQLRIDDTLGVPVPSDLAVCLRAALRLTWS